MKSVEIILHITYNADANNTGITNSGFIGMCTRRAFDTKTKNVIIIIVHLR